MTRPSYCGSRQLPNLWPWVHQLALPRMWSQSLRGTLQNVIRERTYLYLYLRTCRTVSPPTGRKRALSKLSAEQANCLFIVVGVASRYKHVHEWRHRLSPCCVEGVDAAVVPVVCGGWMSKLLNGVAWMLWFRAFRVAKQTNQNIQHTQSRKYKELHNANRACNVCRGWQHLLRIL